MKSKFNTKWKASTQPRKQRKYRHNAPLHVRSKFMSVHLSGDLRKKYSTRNANVRKGDKVKVLRGEFKGKEGKVERADLRRCKIYVSKIEHAKREGSKSMVALEPSNLMITELNTNDKRRFKRAKEK